MNEQEITFVIMDRNEVTISYYSEEDKEEYNDFLLNNNSNIYHTLEWKDALKSCHNFTPLYPIARDHKRDICAVLPLFYIENLLGKRLDSLPLSTCGGMVGNKKYVKPLIKELLKLRQDLKCSSIVIRQYPSEYGDSYEDFGMRKHENWWNQCLAIKDPEVLWNEIEKANRNSIRNAMRNNIEVERITEEKDLAEFHRLELVTGKRHGVYAPPLHFFKKLWGIMHPKGQAEVFLARHNGRAIASNLIFMFKDRVIYGYANSETKEMKLKPNNLLLWEIINWSYAKGYKILDMGGTPKDNKGLFSFKSSFNTLNVSYAHYYFPADTVLIQNTFAGKFGKFLFQKMPTSLSKKVGPFVINKFA